jgi:DNA-directed RNA polymerase specialized sigma24 family protein
MTATDPCSTGSEAERALQPVAADALIRRHLLGTWRYLRMHGASPHEADDLTQEAFVIALQKNAAALDPAATATFLRRTARFLFLRHRRDARESVELADAVEALWQQDCGDDGGDALLAALRRCVGELQGRARQAIERCYGLAASHEPDRAAAARDLGLLPDGLKTLLQRTRALLRTCIERRSR